MENESDLYRMQELLKQFNEERDWDQFHCPRNLAMSLAVEAGELLECFLWVKDGEEIEDSRRSHIAEEAADVLICLVNFCTQAGIDLPNWPEMLPNIRSTRREVRAASMMNCKKKTPRIP